MNIAEFTHLVDLHGADLSRWPQGAVKPALALIDGDAEAKALFDDALALDALLRLDVPGKMDLAVLEDKISAAVRAVPALPKTPAPAFLARPLAFLASGTALALALFTGFIAGAKPAQSDMLVSALAAPEIALAADETLIAEEGDF